MQIFLINIPRRFLLHAARFPTLIKTSIDFQLYFSFLVLYNIEKSAKTIVMGACEREFIGT